MRNAQGLSQRASGGEERRFSSNERERTWRSRSRETPYPRLQLHLLRSVIPLLLLGAVSLTACQQEPEGGQATLNPVAGVLTSEPPPKRKQPDRRPNIIYILSDDQDRQSLAAMPRLRRLFPEVFVNQIITTPLCCPSRETALTGQYAHNHRVFSNLPYRGYLPEGRPFGGWAAAGSRRENIGRWLQRSGYFTALVGKYLNGFDHRRPVPAGWDYFVAALEDEEKGYFNYRLNENGRLRSYGEDARQYSINVLVERAKKALLEAEKAGKPAFIFFTPPTPHTGSVSDRQPFLNPEPAPQERRGDPPFEIPEISSATSFNEADVSDKPSNVAGLPLLDYELQDEYQRLQNSRWLSLLSLDREIAELVRYAERSWRRNVALYSTDNGYLLGQHRLRAKKFPYEESINFPLFIRRPNSKENRRPAASRGGDREVEGRTLYPQLIANTDLVPTILDLAGADPPQGWVLDGRTLLPFLTPRATGSAPKRQAVYIVGFPLGVEDPQGESYRPYRGIRTKQEVFIWYHLPATWPMRSADEFEYYRLDQDPDQLTNLAADRRYQRRIEELRNLTLELASCSGSDCWIGGKRLRTFDRPNVQRLQAGVTTEVQ